ncbi:hypothetical protein, partial [Burkholderia sp. SIMBA_051]|uniref:hypothetical protein n=1 Tax=Burkholderia sp. SIMBA_051 TaxID=3085792 RepID=UPI00397A3691
GETPQNLGSAGFLFSGDSQTDYQNDRRLESCFPLESNGSPWFQIIRIPQGGTALAHSPA